jgi:hypothetical protein
MTLLDDHLGDPLDPLDGSFDDPVADPRAAPASPARRAVPDHRSRVRWGALARVVLVVVAVAASATATALGVELVRTRQQTAQSAARLRHAELHDVVMLRVVAARTGALHDAWAELDAALGARSDQGWALARLESQVEDLGATSAALRADLAALDSELAYAAGRVFSQGRTVGDLHVCVDAANRALTLASFGQLGAAADVLAGADAACHAARDAFT